MTANFYLSGPSPIDKTPSDPFHTDEGLAPEDSKNEDADKLKAENTLLKQRCDRLAGLNDSLASVIREKLQTFKVDGDDIKSALGRLDGDLCQSAAQIQQVTQQVLSAQLNDFKLQQQKAEENIEHVTEEFKQKLSEAEENRANLAADIDKEQQRNVEIVASMHQLTLDHKEELQTAVSEAESRIRNELMLLHEVDLDTVKDECDRMMESGKCELAAKDAEIKALEAEISELRVELDTVRTESSRAIKSLNSQSADALASQLAFLTKQQEEELQKQKSEMEEKLEQALLEADKRKDAALDELKSTLLSAHEKHLEVFVLLRNI